MYRRHAISMEKEERILKRTTGEAQFRAG